MTTPLKKLLPTLQNLTQATREKLAAQVFDLELVREHLTQAAARGQDGVRIQLPNVLNVSGTKAAAALSSWCEKEGLQLVWEVRQTDSPDGRRVSVSEPVISWAPKT